MTVKWNDAKIKAAIRRGAMRGIVLATELARTEAVSLVLNTPKTGRVYTRNGVRHRASAPGEPFASDTGRTVNSIQTSYDESKLQGTISTDENGRRLEMGTQKMEPRPFLRPALVNTRKEGARLLKQEIDRELAK